MTKNSSIMFLKGTSLSTNMFGLNIADYTVPLLMVGTALVTLTVMLLGYLYLHKRALQDAIKEQNMRNKEKVEELTDSEPEMEEEEDAVDKCHWPLDNACMFSSRGPEMSEKEIDALEFCGHIPSEVKKAKVKATQKKLEEEMTAEQREEEQRLQREQLKAIFEMMAEQQEKFGVNSVDEIDEQMRLYM